MSADHETGLARLDAAVQHLDTLDERPVDQHPPVFDEIHHAMREVLAGAHDA
jgi:hypothetical protein